MLDPKLLRHSAQAIADVLQTRAYALDVVHLQALEASRRDLQGQIEQLRSVRNQQAKAIGEAKSGGLDISVLLGEAEDMRAQIDKLENNFSLVQNQLANLVLEIPNLPLPSVPVGSHARDNMEIRRVGDPKTFAFEPLDHVDLGSIGRAMDFDAASRISGARFVVLKGVLAKLHRSLAQMMLDMHTTQHGYTEVYVPYVVSERALVGTGQLPKFIDDLFALEGDRPTYLLPTAEVPVSNLVQDQIIPDEQMPLRYVCHSPCFRAEAGAHGRDTRGMIRQHQFDKVEMVQMTRPEDSSSALEQLTSHAEAVLKALELPYRVMLLCTGDMGFQSAQTYDLEVWLPSQNTYREISSCSNTTDFQARRLSARWRNPKSGKPELLHLLNGSGVAVGRALVAVLENHQQADGSIAIPVALRPYMGGMDQIRFDQNPAQPSNQDESQA